MKKLILIISVLSMIIGIVSCKQSKVKEDQISTPMACILVGSAYCRYMIKCGNLKVQIAECINGMTESCNQMDKNSILELKQVNDCTHALDGLTCDLYHDLVSGKYTPPECMF